MSYEKHELKITEFGESICECLSTTNTNSNVDAAEVSIGS